MTRPTVRRTGGWPDPAPFTDADGRRTSFLSEDVHDTLLAVLGLSADLDRSSATRSRVEKILGEYSVMRELLDDGPRPSQIKARVEAVYNATRDTLDLLSPAADDEALAVRAAIGPDVVEAYRQAARRLQKACLIVRQDLDGQDGRQRPTEHGRFVVLGNLLVFAAEVAPTSTVMARRQFARRALDAAGIPVPGGRAFAALCRGAERRRGLTPDLGEQI